MKFKMAVPEDVLTLHQVRVLEKTLSAGLLATVVRNFPNWEERAKDGDIAGGEMILQNTDYTTPIAGLRRGIHLTISLVSFMQGRNFDGLANDLIALIKGAEDRGQKFMDGVGIFVQMTLDRPVVKTGTNPAYTASGDGLSLLEYVA